jgi:hypothetical protein
VCKGHGDLSRNDRENMVGDTREHPAMCDRKGNRKWVIRRKETARVDHGWRSLSWTPSCNFGALLRESTACLQHYKEAQ